VTIKVNGRTYGHSVESRLSADNIQKLAGNLAQITLDGLWTPVVVNRTGYIGCLQSEDEIEMYAGDHADINRVNVPCTSSAPVEVKARSPANLAPGTVRPSPLTQLSGKETRVNWSDFPDTIEADKFVHVITDGGAKPNPGSAG
jgi:hypothetical protein